LILYYLVLKGSNSFIILGVEDRSKIV